MTNRLYDPDLNELLLRYPLYAQDGAGPDAICIRTFFLGDVRWYILEGQPSGDDFTLFAVVVGLSEPEFGYLSLNELAGISMDGRRYGLGRLQVERDSDFDGMKLSEIYDERLQSFLSEVYG